MYGSLGPGISRGGVGNIITPEVASRDHSKMARPTDQLQVASNLILYRSTGCCGGSEKKRNFFDSRVSAQGFTILIA
jgi:hypothetical protein